MSASPAPGPTPARRRTRVVRASALVAALLPAACGGTSSAGSPPPPPTVTAAFTFNSAHLVVTPGTHVLVKMSKGEPYPPWSMDPRVLAPGSPAGPNATGQVLFIARRKGTARIIGQLPCAGTGCAAMRGWIIVLVRS